MVALAVWMFAQMRRSVTGKARWVLTAIVAVLVVASVGATCDNIAQARDRRTSLLRVSCTTSAATGSTWTAAARVRPRSCWPTGWNDVGVVGARHRPVAETTRVCAYDRAGQGWSDEASSRATASSRPRICISSSPAAGEHGPYVLVGHSTGGTYAMTYAARYPDEVAGLVLLDSSSPEQFTRMPAYPALYQLVLRRGFALTPTLSRLGLGRLPVDSHLPAADAATVKVITSAPQYYRNQRDEISVIPRSSPKHRRSPHSTTGRWLC